MKRNSKFKTEIVNKARELKLWQIQNSNFDKTKNSNCVKNSNCDETQIVMKFKTKVVIKLKLKWWQNSKTEILTKLKKIKLWQNSKCKEDKNSTFEKTQIVTKI